MEHPDIVYHLLSFLELKDIIVHSTINKLFSKTCDLQYKRLLDDDYNNLIIHLRQNQHKLSYITCYELETFRKSLIIAANLISFFSENMLRFSYKEITKLPKSIGQLVKLEKLDVSGNQIIEIPQSINWTTC
jgi:hypothetical protein